MARTHLFFLGTLLTVGLAAASAEAQYADVAPGAPQDELLYGAGPVDRPSLPSATASFGQTAPYEGGIAPRGDYPQTAAPSASVVGDRYAEEFSAEEFSSPPAAAYPPAAAPPAYPTTQPSGPPQAATGAVSMPANATPQANAQLLQSAQLVARIDSEFVTASEVLRGVEETIASNKDRIPPEELDGVRMMLMQRNLQSLVETKLLYADARRSIPKENYDKVEEQINKQFDKEKLPELYKATKTDNRLDLEAKLKEGGSSIEKQKRAYGELLLAKQWLRQQLDLNEEITHDQMLAYYAEHAAEYEFEAKARWEELAVRFDRFPNKAEAYKALAELGNAVWKGASLAEVAKASSQGVTADEGGQYDWTTRGALVSQELNRALFTLPVGQLSPILETERGFHIVRVIERRDAGRTSFVEAQVEIKKELRKQATERQIDAYMAKLREKSRVWTVFDDQTTKGSPQVSGRPPAEPGRR